MTASPEALEMAAVAARAADDKLATDIVVIDVSDQLVITDCFVLASADTERQVNSVVEEIEDKLREAGHKPLRREGTREGRWALLDYNELVVHVQHVDERDYYSLDRLWKDCPVVEIEGVETSRPSDAAAAGGADDSLAPEEPQRDQEL
ncbi:ribosome silencing factor [Dietzia lutea]|uniref:Ribosomal silencing factor RsfS n=1 Tax=Dietzia lutea TaxID=546160 RepID=A0A2S1R653_9ACTN|nr:ribosome silencing factor [Dietzia lutea]AWH91742.1 ribosome silencing factor RsfS [Dietzia lutea]